MVKVCLLLFCQCSMVNLLTLTNEVQHTHIIIPLAHQLIHEPGELRV